MIQYFKHADGRLMAREDLPRKAKRTMGAKGSEHNSENWDENILSIGDPALTRERISHNEANPQYEVKHSLRECL